MSVYTCQDLAEDLEKAKRHNAVLQQMNNYTPPKNKSKLQEYLSRPNVKEYNSIIIDKTFNQCGQPKKFQNGYNECQEEIQDYFQLCMRCECIPSVSALALWLGCSVDTLYTSAKNKQMYEYSDLLQNAIDICKLSNESGAVDGSISPQVFSLLASNYYGLNTSQQVEIKPILQDNQVNNVNTMKVIQEQLQLENNK